MGNKDTIYTGERYVPGIDDNKLRIEHLQRYYSVLPLVKDKIVLDAACGEGYGSSILSTAANKVIAIDVNEQVIARAAYEYADNKKIEFSVASVSDIPLADKSVDVVASFETIEHISAELQSLFLDEITRVLKDDGILVISTPNKEIYSDLHQYKNEFHVKEFYKEEFLDFLSSKFQNIVLYDQYFEVSSIIDKQGEQTQSVQYMKEKTYDCNGKYFIAIASNKSICCEDISHVFMNTLPEYEKNISRIIELQNDVEERNFHLQHLDSEIEAYRNVIVSKEDEIKRIELITSERSIQMKSTLAEQALKLEEKDEVIQAQIQLIEQQKALLEDYKKLESDNVKLQSQVKRMESTLQEKETIIRNKEGHIELLLEVEREYEREKNSRTYKLALFFRKTSLKLLPIDSKRRFIVRAIAKCIRHPRLAIKMINLRRIKNCITILRTEGVASALNHYRLVEEYEKSRVVPVNSEGLSVTVPSNECKSFEEYDKLQFNVWEEPTVSIVIPVYNQFDYTYNCLKSILNNSGDCTYEVIIASDCSTDLTTRINEIISGIKVVNNKENLRFLKNCNNAVQYAKGKYILFLNNDTQVQPNWLKPLITLIQSDSKIGMVGSKLIYSDGYLQEAGGILWKDASAWNYGNRQNPNDSEFNYVREVDYMSGAAIMIKAKLWRKIGGFDLRFTPAYCEDSDLAFEVRKHGYKVMYQPASVVVHFEGISNGTDLNSGQKKYQVDNQQKFYEKWKDVLDKEHFDKGTNVFVARDRGRRKKHILFIDHYVPHYDKDAGSKTTFMYLKMLVKKGYHITFLGDNFYQHEPYTSELQQLGILVLYGPKYAENWKQWLMENMNYFDIFYLNRPHITSKYIDIIKDNARGKIIYYGHDLHYLRIQREYELSGDTKLLSESEDWKKQELYIMNKAHMNYYPSQIECDAIAEINSLIPTKAITAYVYDTFLEPVYDFNNREGMLFVGGFGHGPNIDAVLWFLDKVFPTVYERTHAPFYIVGSKAPEEITSIDREGVIVKGFVSEEELVQLYSQCRMAIVPLRYGAGVKGKVVEALYYGIPIVTTSVGAEGINDIEKVAVIEDDAHTMIQAICDLYEDSDKLIKMCNDSQLLIRKDFSIDAVWNVIREDFE